MPPLKAIALSACLLCPDAQGSPISFGDSGFVYDGTPKSPVISTALPGLSVSLHYDEPSAPDPLPAPGRLYNTVPENLALSYSSLSFSSQSTLGLGDAIIQQPGAGPATSLQVVLVTWARKSQWPVHALLNPGGYVHPITVSAFRKNGAGALELVTESTEDVLIPWRPDSLPDGSPYPHNGIAFLATIPFAAPVQLPQEVFLMVSFNTGNSGFRPLNVPGPYDALNVALATQGPNAGTDQDPRATLWVRQDLWSYPATGVKPPMFRLIGALTPARGSSDPPCDAGSYVLTATWLEGTERKSASHPYTILPAQAAITFGGLKATADGSPRFPLASTIPSGLPVEWSFNGGPDGPVLPGEHVVTARIVSRNHTGEAETPFVLGITREGWMKAFTDAGHIPAAESGDMDDPDKDGIVNLLEYAMGSSPDKAEPGGMAGGLLAGDGGSFRFFYHRNPLATGVRYILEASGDLADPEGWAEVTPSDVSVSRVGELEHIEASLPIPPGMDRRFVRLRVSPAE